MAWIGFLRGIMSEFKSVFLLALCGHLVVWMDSAQWVAPS